MGVFYKLDGKVEVNNIDCFFDWGDSIVINYVCIEWLWKFL